jgi:hypothetical protein
VTQADSNARTERERAGRSSPRAVTVSGYGHSARPGRRAGRWHRRVRLSVQCRITSSASAAAAMTLMIMAAASESVTVTGTMVRPGAFKLPVAPL